ncbi:hypothetical protein MMC24_006479 [Lignoscripta atroalba]|nr:hypothetical protein [Lignoscripta atroalba]
MLLGFCTLSVEVPPKQRTKYVRTSISCLPKSPSRRALSEVKDETLNKRRPAVLHLAIVSEGGGLPDTPKVISEDGPKATVQLPEASETTPQPPSTNNEPEAKAPNPESQPASRKTKVEAPVLQPQPEETKQKPIKLSLPKKILKQVKKVSFAAMPEYLQPERERSSSSSSSVSDDSFIDPPMPVELPPGYISRWTVPEFHREPPVKRPVTDDAIIASIKNMEARSVKTRSGSSATNAGRTSFMTPLPEYIRPSVKNRGSISDSRRVDEWNTRVNSPVWNTKDAVKPAETSAESLPHLQWDSDSDLESAIDVGTEDDQQSTIVSEGAIPQSLPHQIHERRSRSLSVDSISDNGSAIDTGEEPSHQPISSSSPKVPAYQPHPSKHKREPIIIYRPKMKGNVSSAKDPIFVVRNKARSTAGEHRPDSTPIPSSNYVPGDQWYVIPDLGDNQDQGTFPKRPSYTAPSVHTVSSNDEEDSGLGIDW